MKKIALVFMGVLLFYNEFKFLDYPSKGDEEKVDVSQKSQLVSDRFYTCFTANNIQNLGGLK